MELRARVKFESVADRISGGWWIVLSGILFAAMLAVFKLAGEELPVVQILFLRQIMVLAVILPALLHDWPRARQTLRSQSPKLQILRIVLSAGAMLAGFTGLVHLPLAESTTITFTRVIFAVLLSAVILGEVVGARRWGATALGFVGVLIVSAPSATEAWNPYTLLALVAALFTGSVTVILRRLATLDGPGTIMIWHSVGLLILLIMPTALVWKTPTLEQWGLIGILGLLMAGAQWTSIRALKVSEASAVAPFEYLRLIWAALFGYLVFHDIPDTRLAVGAAFVLGAALLASRTTKLTTAPVAGQPAITPSAGS